MADCKNLKGCIFFNDQMKNMPGTSSVFKKKYCKDDFASCARYVVCEALGKNAVPDDLYPNQSERAQEIIG